MAALAYALAAVVCALVALAALRSVLAEVAMWREGRWRSADVETLRAAVGTQVAELNADVKALQARTAKSETAIAALTPQVEELRLQREMGRRS